MAVEQRQRVGEMRVFGKEESEGKWEGNCGRLRRAIREGKLMQREITAFNILIPIYFFFWK